MFCLKLLYNAENIIFAHDQIFVAFDFYLGAGIFTEKDAVAFFDFKGNTLAIVAKFTVADCRNFSLGGLFGPYPG